MLFLFLNTNFHNDSRIIHELFWHGQRDIFEKFVANS